VWDITTNNCVGVLSSSSYGHSAPVTSLCLLPAAGQGNESYIVSGGADCEVKLWKPNGEFVHSCSHLSCVTALCPFQDSIGGTSSNTFCRMLHNVLQQVCRFYSSGLLMAVLS